MPLKNGNKSNAVYNEFKVVWNAPSQKAKQSTTNESKPLLDGKNEISSDEKAGFNISYSRILICKPDGRLATGIKWSSPMSIFYVPRIFSTTERTNIIGGGVQ